MNARGAKREHQVAAMLRDDGWIVYRSAGSHGNADLVAMRADQDKPLLLQVKSSAAGPFAHFRPAEREALLAEGKAAGAAVVLVWWPPRREPLFLDSVAWPIARVLVAVA